jgi:hypothetical protein
MFAGSYQSLTISASGITVLGRTNLGQGTTSVAPLKFTSGSLLTSAEAGVMEFLTDRFYATITTATARKMIALSDTDYGGMYTYDKNVSLAINTANVYHAYHLVTAGDVVTGLVNGWTFAAGRTVDANITSEANTGGKLRIVCSAAHSLTTGDIVMITNANDARHNKKTRVSFDGTNPTTEFICDDITYVAGAGASAAEVDEPAYLKCTSATNQIYRLVWTVTGSSAAGNKVFKFEPVQNITDLDNCAAETTCSSTTLENMGGQGFITVNTGDRVWIQCKNTSGDTTDFAMKHFNLTVMRA